jgi:hypothetical protein
LLVTNGLRCAVASIRATVASTTRSIRLLSSAARQGAPWAHDICEVVAPLCDDLGWLLAAGGWLVVSVVLNALIAARTV